MWLLILRMQRMAAMRNNAAHEWGAECLVWAALVGADSFPRVRYCGASEVCFAAQTGRSSLAQHFVFRDRTLQTTRKWWLSIPSLVVSLRR